MFPFTKLSKSLDESNAYLPYLLIDRFRIFQFFHILKCLELTYREDKWINSLKTRIGVKIHQNLISTKLFPLKKGKPIEVFRWKCSERSISHHYYTELQKLTSNTPQVSITSPPYSALSSNSSLNTQAVEGARTHFLRGM